MHAQGRSGAAEVPKPQCSWRALRPPACAACCLLLPLMWVLRPESDFFFSDLGHRSHLAVSCISPGWTTLPDACTATLGPALTRTELSRSSAALNLRTRGTSVAYGDATRPPIARGHRARSHSRRHAPPRMRGQTAATACVSHQLGPKTPPSPVAFQRVSATSTHLYSSRSATLGHDDFVLAMQHRLGLSQRSATRRQRRAPAATTFNGPNTTDHTITCNRLDGGWTLRNDVLKTAWRRAVHRDGFASPVQPHIRRLPGAVQAPRPEDGSKGDTLMVNAENMTLPRVPMVHSGGVTQRDAAARTSGAAAALRTRPSASTTGRRRSPATSARLSV